MPTKKITRAEIIKLASLRNEFTGHTAADDTARVRLPKSATDDELRAALDAALTQDFNEDFGGKPLEAIPNDLVLYMTDVLGLDAGAGEEEEEETVTLAEEEGEEETVTLAEEEGDDDLLADDDDSVEVSEAESADEEGEPEIDDDEPVIVSDDPAPAPAPVNKPVVSAPVPAAKVAPGERVVSIDSVEAPTGASLEDIFSKILTALAQGCEIVIRDPKAVAAFYERAVDVPVSGCVVPDKAPKAAPVSEAPITRGKGGRKPESTGKTTTQEQYVTAAYNAARAALTKDSAFLKPNVRLAIAKVLKAQSKGKRGKPLSELGDRGVMSCLLDRLKELSVVQFKAEPGASKKDAREFVVDTLKMARAKAVELAKAAKAAKAGK